VTGHVFISYSRTDRPYVEKLAAHLSRAGIPVWYDYEIVAGDRFASVLQAQIDTCAAFLVVLTPASVESAWVYREVSHAIHREKRVLPLLLQKCDPHLLLSGLHHEDVTRGQLPTDRLVTQLRTLTGAPAAHPVSKNTSRQKAYVVDPYGRGDFTSISAAMSAARAGDRVLVRPGRYYESLKVDRDLEIIGDGPVGDIVIDMKDDFTLYFDANGGRVANLTFRQIGGRKDGWAAVQVGAGRLKLEGCHITSVSAAAVSISADAQLRDNHIKLGRAGVYVYGTATLENNTITRTEGWGVHVSPQASATVRRNRVEGTQSDGISISGKGILEDNVITGNRHYGVSIMADGYATLRRNTISANGMQAVHVEPGGGGLFEDNDLRGNAQGVWAVRGTDRASVIRRGNKT
jgi:parallel beta-helix repeat protein